MSAQISSLSGASSHRIRPRLRSLAWFGLAALSTLPLAACGGDGGKSDAATSDAITVYTCVSDETIQSVISDFRDRNPGTKVDLFRAPTGELNARVAADKRSGGLRADVIWACDPLTMQAYVDQGLVGGWVPDDASGIPADFRTGDYVGAHILYMVAVSHDGSQAPKTWNDLTDPGKKVAVPDPSFAASALGALGYFADSPDYGVQFYDELKHNGAVQVSSPDDVTVGVAQGVYDAGITIATSAYKAQQDGSPVQVAWPEPGAISIYGPVALAKDSADKKTAKDFVAYVVSKEGQTTVAKSGGYPTMEGIDGPPAPDGAPVVLPDWQAIGQQKDRLLSEYQSIFGG